MAKLTRTILFVAAESARASAVAAAFTTAAGKLGLPWGVRSSGVPVEAKVLEGVTIAVAVDLANLTLENWTGRVEGLTTSPDVELAVNKLLARLLGGNDEAVIAPKPVGTATKKVHTVKLSRETAGRKGRGVTVVSELPLNEDQLNTLATKLKNACGTGGTAKDSRIELQGDHRDKIATELEKLGYKVKRSGG